MAGCREYTSYNAGLVEAITIAAFDANLDVYGITLDAAHAGLTR